MELSYKRHLNHSFMIIEDEKGPCEEYEMEVLLNQKIDNILPIKIFEKENGYQYWFDITGKQSMATYLEREKIKETLLINILCGLQDTCNTMTNFLLEENRLRLSGEYIYFCYKTNKIFFTYIPFYQNNIYSDFSTLLEFVLQKLDHADKVAVKLGYDLYQLIQKEQCSLKELLCDLEFYKPDGYSVYDEKKQESEVQVPEKRELKIETTMKSTSIFSKIKDIIENINLDKLWNYIVSHFAFRKSSNRPEYDPIITVTEAWSEDDNKHPTECLFQPENLLVGKLVYNGNGKFRDLPINKDSCMLGKDTKRNDLVIDHRSVSHLHARIEKIDESYYIEDLNSTNGTYVNGSLLEYRDKIKLNLNDKIVFGGVEYIFL